MGRPTTMSGENKRAKPRYQVRPGHFAQFSALGQKGIKDLSLGGISIEDPENDFSKGTVIELELHLGGSPIGIHALVIRTDPGEGFAVEFLDAPPNVREQLEKYFSDLSNIT